MINPTVNINSQGYYSLSASNAPDLLYTILLNAPKLLYTILQNAPDKVVKKNS